MNIKQTIFNILPRPAISKTKKTVLVATYGRSGSAMFYRALKNSVARHPLFKNRVGHSIVSLDNLLKPGFIYHTHALPPISLSSLAKFSDLIIIYLYSNPIHAALSTYRKAQDRSWWEKHCYAFGLRGLIPDREILLRCDFLDFNGHFNKWRGLKEPSVLFVKYESLWSEIEKINDFVGFNINLPDRIPRQTTIAEENICMDDPY